MPSLPFGRKQEKLRPACQLPIWQQLLAEADLCARYATEAAQCGRFCAACGLILTADALCRRALGATSNRSEQNVIESEVVPRLGFYQNEVGRLLEQAVTTHLEDISS